jgi:hypothetical protein
VLDKDCDLLRDLLGRYPDYTLTFTGHSLGAGVAAMLTMVVVLYLDKLGVVQMGKGSADVNNSVVLQDTCIPEDALLKDPRRLYAPGRIYHIVERKSFRYPLFLINV